MIHLIMFKGSAPAVFQVGEKRPIDTVESGKVSVGFEGEVSKNLPML